MLAAILTTGCVSGSWKGAKRKDTVGAYHQFLRDHPMRAHPLDGRGGMRVFAVRTEHAPTSDDRAKAVGPPLEKAARQMLAAVI